VKLIVVMKLAVNVSSAGPDLGWGEDCPRANGLPVFRVHNCHSLE